MRKTFMTAMALLFSSGFNCLAADLPPVEQSIEAASDTVSFPTNGTIVTARSCSSCPVRTLSLAPTSQFFFASSELDLDTFKKALAKTPHLAVTIHFRAEDNTITRAVLSSW